jgi:hypothetical protein
MGVWVCPRAGLADAGKRKFLTTPGLDLRPLGHPACSQSLYRLGYPGSYELVLSQIALIIGDKKIDDIRDNYHIFNEKDV